MIWILVGKYFSQDAKLYSRCPGQEFVPLALLEQGDILHQQPGVQKAFQSTFFHSVCLQMLQISEVFQNFSDLEQSIFF